MPIFFAKFELNRYNELIKALNTRNVLNKKNAGYINLQLPIIILKN